MPTGQFSGGKMKKLTLGFLALATALATTSVASANTLQFSGGVNIKDNATDIGQGDFWSTSTTSQIGPLHISPAASNTAKGTGGPTTVLGSQIPAGSPLVEPMTWNITNGTSANAGDEFLFNAGTIEFLVTGSIVVETDNGSALQFSGTGTWMEAGFTNTPGTFIYNVNDVSDEFGAGPDGSSGGQWTLQAVPTPEPSSLILLGSGLLGLAFVAFRKAKPAGLTLNS